MATAVSATSADGCVSGFLCSAATSTRSLSSASALWQKVAGGGGPGVDHELRVGGRRGCERAQERLRRHSEGGAVGGGRAPLEQDDRAPDRERQALARGQRRRDYEGGGGVALAHGVRQPRGQDTEAPRHLGRGVLEPSGRHGGGPTCAR